MEAFITLATNDSYAIGACTLAHSLRRSGTTRQLAVMITSEVTDNMRRVLHKLFDHVEVVNLLHSGDPVHLKLMDRQDLGGTFTKLHCWTLTQYSKAVFMDADTLVLKNIDDIFEREEFSAAPDPGWPDCFNSGVFVFRPSLETYGKLLEFAVEHGSFDGADQGLLNRFFSNWATQDISHHLPFLYNCSMWEFYSYLPALREFRPQVRVVHFIGPVKPWHQSVTEHSETDERTVYKNDFLRQWWGAFAVGVQPHLSPELDTLDTNVLYRETSEPPMIPPTTALDGISRISIKFPEPVSAEITPHPCIPTPEPAHSKFSSGHPVLHISVVGTTDRPLELVSSPVPLRRDETDDLSSILSSTSSGIPSPREIEPTSVSPETEVAEFLAEPTREVDKHLPTRMQNQELHRTAWEHGHIDYLGVDRFDNILAKLNESLNRRNPGVSQLTDDSPRKKRKREDLVDSTVSVVPKVELGILTEP